MSTTRTAHRAARRVTALALLLVIAFEAHGAAELEALCDGVDAVNAWDSHGALKGRSVTFYYAGSRDGFHPLGVTADRRERGDRSSGLCLVKDISPRGNALAVPQGYRRVWWDRRSGATRDGTIWRPICPRAYVAVGFMVDASYRMPRRSALRCVREDLTVVGEVREEMIFNDAGSQALQHLGVWSVTASDGIEDLGTVFTAAQHARPERDTKAVRLIRKDAIRLGSPC